MGSGREFSRSQQGIIKRYYRNLDTITVHKLSEIVSDALENGDEITLPGIGKLKISERPARTGRNPQTGQSIQIAAKKVVKYVPAKALTDAVN